MSLRRWANSRGDVVADTGFAPVGTLRETRRAQAVLLAQVAVFAIGATSAIQIANFTVTLTSAVCLLLVPGYLLMEHRGADLLPLVLATLGWISFLVSCLVNGVSMLWSKAVSPAAFSLYLIGLTVLTGRAVDAIATVSRRDRRRYAHLLPHPGDRTHPHRQVPLHLEVRHRPRGGDPRPVRAGEGAGACARATDGARGARAGQLGPQLPVARACVSARLGDLVRSPPSRLPDPAWVAVRRGHRVRAGVRVRDANRRPGRAVRAHTAAQDDSAGCDPPADASDRANGTADDHHRDHGEPAARLGGGAA